MSELSSIATLTIVTEGNNTYSATGTYTENCLHAYVQEHWITSAENKVIFDMADDPGYADFVLFRVEVLEWGATSTEVYIKVTSGSDSVYFPIMKALPVFELPSVTAYTDSSNGGSPDTIDEITIIGNGLADATVGAVTLADPILIRVTAYTVES